MPTTVLLHVLSYVGPQEVKNLALTATGFGRAAIIMTNMNQIRELQTFIDALIQTLSHTAGETHSLRLEILEGLIKRLTSIRNHVSPNCKDLKSLKTNDVFHIKDQLIDVLKELTPKELKAIAKISPPNFYPHFWKEARAAKYEELYCQETGRMVGDILKALASVEEFDVAIGFIEGLGEFGRYVFEQMSDKEVACTLRDISRGLVNQGKSDKATALAQMIINSKYGSEADVNDEIVQALNNKANVLLESHLEAINTNRTEDLNQETCPTKIEETVEFLVDMTYSVLFTSIVAVMCFRAIDQCVRIGMSGIRALSRF